MPVRIKNTRLVYFPVPKVACSSIKHALLNFNENGLASKLPARLPFRGLVKTPHSYYPSPLFNPLHVVRYGRLKWFCVVRDPLERFMSAYAHRIGVRRDLHRSGRTGLRNPILNRSPDLGEFVDRFEDYYRSCYRVKHHFRPLCDYLGKKPNRFDRVFSLSELEELPAFIADEGARVTLPHLNSGPKKNPVPELTSSQRDKIESFYADDYRHWGSFLD